MAHKTGAGSTKNNRDSQAKKLGLKVANSQYVKKGMILVRQRGLKYKPGFFVEYGKDFTLYANEDGYVEFKKYIIHIKKFI
jgi:large subunit ribosomal protein L27